MELYGVVRSRTESCGGLGYFFKTKKIACVACNAAVLASRDGRLIPVRFLRLRATTNYDTSPTYRAAARGRRGKNIGAEFGIGLGVGA